MNEKPVGVLPKKMFFFFFGKYHRTTDEVQKEKFSPQRSGLS
jgi:hypothetical protein